MAQAAVPSTSNPSSTICDLDIGNNIFVVANIWMGEKLIHIRHYGQLQSGGKYPTKKGIALTLRRWKELSIVRNEVNRVVRDVIEKKEVSLFTHLGGNHYVSVDSKYPGVGIRRYWRCEETENLKPSRKGIHLTFDQWERLGHYLDTMQEYLPELEDVTPCYMELDHLNQLGYLACSECNPNQLHLDAVAK